MIPPVGPQRWAVGGVFDAAGAEIKDFLWQDICWVGLPVGGFLSSMHCQTVASRGMDFSQRSLSAVPKILQLYSFRYLARPASLWTPAICGRSAFPLPRHRNFQVRLFFPILFHQWSSAGGKPGMIPRPLLWGKEISREQRLESLPSRSKLWCGFCARSIILPIRSWDNVISPVKDRLSVTIFEFHLLKKEKVHDTWAKQIKGVGSFAGEISWRAVAL